MQLKVVAQHVVLVSVSILITLVVLDLGYRHIIEPERVVPRSLGRYDSALGWVLRPNASATSRATGSKVTYEINSKGLRGREREYAKEPGTWRVALLGDSRTFGYGVPIEDHFSTLLESYFRNVEVINLGVPGYGIDQELLAFRSEGVKYRPDVVVAYVAHFGDQRHMFADRFGAQKPRFVLRDGALSLSNVPVPKAGAGLDAPHRIDWYLTQRSPMYRDLSRAAVHTLKRLLRSAPVVSAGATETSTPVQDSIFVDRMYELALVILEEIQREATAHNARFVLVTQLTRLHRESMKRGIMSFDVSMPLANPNLQLPRNLHHLNAAGNGVLAWEIAQFLTQSGLIPVAHRSERAGR